jgi:hypothetical protein
MNRASWAYYFTVLMSTLPGEGCRRSTDPAPGAASSQPTNIVVTARVTAVTCDPMTENLLNRWRVESQVISASQGGPPVGSHVAVWVHSVILTFDVPYEEIVGHVFRVTYRERFSDEYGGHVDADEVGQNSSAPAGRGAADLQPGARAPGQALSARRALS